MQFMNLLQMMQQMDDIQLLKGEYFLTAMLVVYSIPYALVFFQVTIRFQKLQDLGEIFVIYTFWNIFEFIYSIVIMMQKGSKTNAFDEHIKKLMIKLNKDSARMQIYGNNGQVYKLKSHKGQGPQVFILKKKWGGLYQSEIDGKIHRSLDQFEAINTPLLELLKFYD